MKPAGPDEAWSLKQRLRGRYPVGPRLPNGEPEMGWREYPPVNVDGSPAKCHPPINEEAAKRIEALEGALREAQSVLAMLVEPGAIQQTTVINAYAAAKTAEAKARAALTGEKG